MLARGSTNIIPSQLGLESDLSNLWCAVNSWCVAHCRVSFLEPGCKGGGATMSVDIANVPSPLKGLGRRWVALIFI